MAWSVNDDLVKGNDYHLWLVDLNGGAMSASLVTSGKVLAYAQSCSMEINSDTLDVTSKLSCRWNAVVAGNGSYSINSDALYCKAANADTNGAETIDNLYEDMVNGDNVGWVMGQMVSGACGTIRALDTGSTYYYGEGAITSLSITAGNNEIVQSSISITGSGKPEKGGPSA